MIGFSEKLRRRGLPGLAFGISLLVLAFSTTIDIAWSVRGSQPHEFIEASALPEANLDLPGLLPVGSDISAALEKPVFHADRKRFEPPPAAVAVVQVPPPDFKLAGIVEGAEMRWAYMEMKDGGEAQRVKTGDEIDGWIVESIEEDLVRLRRGSEEAILSQESGTTNKGARPR